MMHLLEKISLWCISSLADLYCESGGVCLSHKQPERAERALTQALSFNPDLSEAYHLRGRARYRLGNYDGAIADYTAALKVGPKCPELYLNRGLAHYSKAEFDDAFGDMNVAIYLNPRQGRAYSLRALVEEAEGNLNAAIADYTDAIRLNPRIDEAYTHRGSARADGGDLSGAIDDFQHYLEVGGGWRHGDQSNVEALIAALRGQLEQQSSR